MSPVLIRPDVELAVVFLYALGLAKLSPVIYDSVSVQTSCAAAIPLMLPRISQFSFSPCLGSVLDPSPSLSPPCD